MNVWANDVQCTQTREPYLSDRARTTRVPQKSFVVLGVDDSRAIIAEIGLA